MSQEDSIQIIERYEKMRRRFAELEKELDELDRELASLEPRLPEGYIYPGDAG